VRIINAVIDFNEISFLYEKKFITGFPDQNLMNIEVAIVLKIHLIDVVKRRRLETNFSISA
jgi:hypothetical protein